MIRMAHTGDHRMAPFKAAFPAIVLGALAIAVSVSCETPPKDCRAIHRGHFEDRIDPQHPTFITRTDSDQTEEMPSMGLKSRYRISWKNDCTYQLFDKRVLQGTPFRAWNPADTLTVVIEARDAKGFSYTANANWINYPIKGYQLIR